MNIDETIDFLEAKGYRVLNEMAYDRKKIQDTFFNYLNNIIQNYALIKYVNETGEKRDLLNHWKIELRAYLLQLNKMKMKSGNKEHAIQEEYAKTEYSLNDIVDIIEMKFELENINADLVHLADCFRKDIEKLVHVISNGTKDDVISFINEI